MQWNFRLFCSSLRGKGGVTVLVLFVFSALRRYVSRGEIPAPSDAPVERVLLFDLLKVIPTRHSFSHTADWCHAAVWREARSLHRGQFFSASWVDLFVLQQFQILCLFVCFDPKYSLLFILNGLRSSFPQLRSNRIPFFSGQIRII